jgi:hypothetical protein
LLTVIAPTPKRFFLVVVCCCLLLLHLIMTTHSKLASLVAIAEGPASGRSYRVMARHFLEAVLAKKDGGGKVLLGVWVSAIGTTLLIAAHQRLTRSSSSAPSPSKAADAKATAAVVSGDRYEVRGMFNQLLMILKLAFPSLASKQSFHLLAYTILLCLRIVLTIKIARVTGTLGKVCRSGTTTIYHRNDTATTRSTVFCWVVIIR